jgi:hypothetical protein
MNSHLTHFYHGRDITFIRSRPYQKNDAPVWRRTTRSSASSWSVADMTVRLRLICGADCTWRCTSC